MKKTPKSAPKLNTETIPADFTPSQTQIDTLARRLMPEIKSFFSDEQIQREFEAWKDSKLK